MSDTATDTITVSIGNPISAKKAKEIGLLDELVSEDSLAADAIAFAKSKIGQPVPRSSEGDANQDGIKNPDIFDEFRAKNGRKMRGFDAPNAAIDSLVSAKRPLKYLAERVYPRVMRK